MDLKTLDQDISENEKEMLDAKYGQWNTGWLNDMVSSIKYLQSLVNKQNFNTYEQRLHIDRNYAPL